MKLRRVLAACSFKCQHALATRTRNGKVSRNTVAVGIVVLDHLRSKCPVLREEVIADGGEVKGARSGLGKVLEKYNIPSTYLKEVTTRQAPQDGQRLFQQFEWGKKLAGLNGDDRDNLLIELVAVLEKHAMTQLQRENLKLSIDRRQSPKAWIGLIVENAKGRSGGVVEQHLVGAKLARRFTGIPIPNYPAHAADQQTAREGDFTIGGLVYHVTASPTNSVLEKCAGNVRAGLHPILIVPYVEEHTAKVHARDKGIEKEVTIISIEDFVALNIIELAIGGRKISSVF